jgi:hypothetical protein
MEKTTKKIVENTIKLNSLSQFANRKILFALYNEKSGESSNRFNKYKFTTTIKDAVNNSLSKLDLNYDTRYLSVRNKKKTLFAITDIPQYLDIELKSQYLDLVNNNKEFAKNNKVSNEIIENIKYFENLVNNLK